MYASVRREIPEFLYDELVYCDNLTFKRNQKSCLLLTQDLKFYEFQCKQLIQSIELKKTCLSKIHERLKQYIGNKGKWYHNEKDVMGTAGTTSNSTPTMESAEICFGKYIYTNIVNNKLYLIVRCWDKLLVLQRLPDATGFRLTVEYEQVANFKLVHGKVKYQAAVEIQFENAHTICTDFQDAISSNESTKASTEMSRPSDFKHLLERVRTAQTELQLHKAATQKDFEQLRNMQAFGLNRFRSLKIEEKQMLTRCGDIWFRYTTLDALVIGVPLLNTCSAPNLTILRNLKPCFKLSSSDDDIAASLHYQYRWYQLKQKFDCLETLETFFQSNDESLQATIWTECGQPHLLPDSYAVLLIKLEVTQIIALETCALLLLFEIEKVCEHKKAESRTFEHQIFLKNIDFQRILHERRAHELSFTNYTLHQDFLAIAMSTHETKLSIKFQTAQDLAKFEQLLVAKYDLEVIKRVDVCKEDFSTEVDEYNAEHKPTTFPHMLLFNRQKHSLWHGLLILKDVAAIDAANALKTYWKFYTQSEERAFLFVKLLLEELLRVDCNVAHIEYNAAAVQNIKVADFVNAMRQELKTSIEIANEGDVSENVAHLAKLQLQTDLLADVLN